MNQMLNNDDLIDAAADTVTDAGDGETQGAGNVFDDMDEAIRELKRVIRRINATEKTSDGIREDLRVTREKMAEALANEDDEAMQELSRALKKHNARLDRFLDAINDEENVVPNAKAALIATISAL